VIETFIKMYNPKIVCEYENFLERLVTYIDIMVEFYAIKVFICVSLKEYLTPKDLEQFLKHCMYKEVSVLNIQQSYGYKVTEEKCIVIDKDLCEIVVSS
jgi:CRISPR type II-A-associated protein Csn2